MAQIYPPIREPMQEQVAGTVSNGQESNPAETDP